ncbi:MAG: transcriptional activator NhaR [Bryobacteraceae bacterium]|nr:transcriptional activator NhaR [Bryobacteraceae bacterium]MDW8378863.1 transcriptional activator NhaR [Bryobacterales bacterium]
MEWLNYHHLLYFYVVAREGSIAKASEQLLLAQPTISGQIHALEENIGEKLFQRSGRRLVLTEFGRTVYQYAEEIFSLGRELQDFIRGRPTGKPLRLVVGVADTLPKTLVHRLLSPVFQIREAVHLICHEDHPENLLVSLSLHKLDVMLTDTLVTSSARIRSYHHLVGSSGVSFFATGELVKRYSEGFPKSLDGAPFLLPLENTGLRRMIEHWFNAQGIRPRLVAEFQDTALAKAFGQGGLGIFCAPTVVSREVESAYRVVKLGDVPDLQFKVYAVSIERKFKHPAVLAILEAARFSLFGEGRDSKNGES